MGLDQWEVDASVRGVARPPCHECPVRVGGLFSFRLPLDSAGGNGDLCVVQEQGEKPIRRYQSSADTSKAALCFLVPKVAINSLRNATMYRLTHKVKIKAPLSCPRTEQCPYKLPKAAPLRRMRSNSGTPAQKRRRKVHRNEGERWKEPKLLAQAPTRP